MNDRFNAMNDRVKTTNGVIVYKKRMERNDRFNTMEWNRTIVLTQRNRTEQSFYHNGMERTGSQTASERKINGIWMGTERERNGKGRSVAQDTNGNFLLTPTVHSRSDSTINFCWTSNMKRGKSVLFLVLLVEIENVAFNLVHLV